VLKIKNLEIFVFNFCVFDYKSKIELEFIFSKTNFVLLESNNIFAKLLTQSRIRTLNVNNSTLMLEKIVKVVCVAIQSLANNIEEQDLENQFTIAFTSDKKYQKIKNVLQNNQLRYIKDFFLVKY